MILDDDDLESVAQPGRVDAGVAVGKSELIGALPRAAVEESARYYLGLSAHS